MKHLLDISAAVPQTFRETNKRSVSEMLQLSSLSLLLL